MKMNPDDYKFYATLAAVVLIALLAFGYNLTDIAHFFRPLVLLLFGI